MNGYMAVLMPNVSDDRMRGDSERPMHIVGQSTLWEFIPYRVMNACDMCVRRFRNRP